MNNPKILATQKFAQAINKFIREEAQDWRPVYEIYKPWVKDSVLRWRVVRPDDLLTADFLLHNLQMTPDQPARLVRKHPSRSAYVAMELQGQHFGEEVLIVGEIPEVSPEDITGQLRNTPPPPPHVMRARFAHPSRIVVRMPTTLMSIDFTLEKLLEVIMTWPLSLDLLATTPSPVKEILVTPSHVSSKLIDRNLLSAVAGLLQTASMELQTSLKAKNAEALGRLIIGQAHRSAVQAGADLRSDKPAAGRLLDTAAGLSRQLSSNKALDPEIREMASALFQVALAEKAAQQALISDDLNFSKLIQVSRLFLLWLSPHEPSDHVTALELPYRLISSPHAGTVFTHPLDPQTLAGRTELWRTTLFKKTETDPEPLGVEGTPFTVMWSPDYSGSQPITKKDPFRMSLFPHHRDNLVRLMAGHLEYVNDHERYKPTPATAQRLQLSAWGGVLELDGVWKVLPHGVGVEAWSNDLSYGRDERVRVAEAGYLFPYGHRAALVTLTERLVEPNNPTGFGAFLRQRQFIVLREPEKEFPAPGQKYAGRKLPFHKITCLTRRTPDLQQATYSPAVVPGVSGIQAFWPIAIPGSAPVMFDFESVDLAGRRSVFSSPVIFLFKTFIDKHSSQMYKIHDAWEGPADSPNLRSRVAFGSQVVRMAPVSDGKPGDVDVPLDNVFFQGTSANGQVPPFHPAIRFADARLKALESISGKQAVTKVAYEDLTYLQNGYTNNPWKVFLKLTDGFQVRMGSDVPTDRVGGIAQPSQTLSAISNGSGAVSGSVGSLTSGSVEPDDMFPDAKILGGFDLKDLIAPFVATGLGAIPGFKTEEFSDKIVTSWEYKNNDVSSPIPGLVTGAGGKSALELGAKMTAWFTYPDPDLGFKDKDGNPAPDFGAGTDEGWKDPEVEATGKLTNFKLNFFGCIIVWFDEFSFKSSLKNKFDPNPKLHDENAVVFGGPLEFVNTLSDLIPSTGFSDPPIIKPSLTDLQVGYDFALPNVEVGIFALKNMKIGAILIIPFNGDPVALRFFFCTRESPFLLSVSMFGGGGFFAIVTNASGVQEIEAAFEFGAFASFDVGVASGGVYLKAGVYFHWKTDTVELEGYVEMGGELSVLGIISISITLHLSLGYYKENNKAEVRGQATLKIEVKLLFFSIGVSVEVERRFSGSDNADPGFAELITNQDTWSSYCAAFA